MIFERIYFFTKRQADGRDSSGKRVVERIVKSKTQVPNTGTWGTRRSLKRTNGIRDDIDRFMAEVTRTG